MNDPGSQYAFSLADQRLAAEDERASHELAIRCGLKSVRGEQPLPPPRRSVPTPPRPRLARFTPQTIAKRALRPRDLTEQGLRQRMAVLRAQVAAEPGDRYTRTKLGMLSAEWERRRGG